MTVQRFRAVHTIVIALILSIAGHPAMASAQTPASTAPLTGVVVDSTGKPVPDATVSVRNATATTRTNALGRFVIPGVPLGNTSITVRKIGWATAEQGVAVQAGGNVEHRIQLLAVQTLEERNITASSAFRTAFDDRRARRHGIAIDSAILNKRGDFFSVLNNLPLTRVTRNGNNVEVKLRQLASRKTCEPSAYLDGLPADIHQLMLLPPSEFKAIELLPDAVVPPEYFVRPGCGVMLFWSKKVKW